MNAKDQTTELAAGWIDAWKRMDIEWLRERLAPDFVHISPFGTLEGRDFYLATVEPMARKSVAELHVRDVVARGNQAAVWFDNRTTKGIVPSCDWVRVENGRIQEVRSFYDTQTVRATLSPSEQTQLSGVDEKREGRGVSTQPWPIIAVANVVKSSAWYMRLLNAQENHPGAGEFNQILEVDGTILLSLHHWGPSGPRGDHVWPSLASPGDGRVGNGLLLWFVVDDFDAAWQRTQDSGAIVEEPPNTDNGTRMRAFVVRDPDGYYVAINEARY